MRFAALLAVGLLGFAAGWIVRGIERDERAPLSTPRRTVPERPDTADRALAPQPNRPTPAEAAEKPAETAAEPPAPPSGGEDSFRKMLKGQRAQMRAFSTMQARQKLEGAIRELGYDETTTKSILDALLKEAETRTDLAYDMLLGDVPLDPDAFLWIMGVGPKLSEETERNLALMLGDEGLQAVRSRLKAVHEKQMDDLAEMSISMMAIPDLRPDQRAQLKEFFNGRNMMQDQMAQMSTVLSDRAKLERLLKGEGLRDEMEKSFAPRREKMSAILDDRQYERYLAFEKQAIAQAEMGLKMLSGMMGAKPEAPAK